MNQPAGDELRAAPRTLTCGVREGCSRKDRVVRNQGDLKIPFLDISGNPLTVDGKQALVGPEGALQGSSIQVLVVVYEFCDIEYCTRM